MAAISRALERGELSGKLPTNIPLERPKNRDHGDYASSIALQLAKAAGKNPREVAELLKKDLETLPEVSSVDIAGPGFINITLNRASQADLVRTILQAKEIGKIEARLTADPPVKKTSNAPSPISPVTARSTGSPNFDTTDPRSIKSMSTSEWIEAERQRQMKKQEARNR